MKKVEILGFWQKQKQGRKMLRTISIFAGQIACQSEAVCAKETLKYFQIYQRIIPVKKTFFLANLFRIMFSQAWESHKQIKQECFV